MEVSLSGTQIVCSRMFTRLNDEFASKKGVRIREKWGLLLGGDWNFGTSLHIFYDVC